MMASYACKGLRLFVLKRGINRITISTFLHGYNYLIMRRLLPYSKAASIPSRFSAYPTFPAVVRYLIFSTHYSE